MRLVFLGTPAFGATILEALIAAGHEIALVVSQPDRLSQQRGRSKQPLPSPVSTLAKKRKLPLETPRNITEITEQLTDTAADVFVVAAYGQLLSADVLKLADGRWLNVHASLLPAYRGATPIQQAIFDGKPATGVTIMEVTPPLDAGPIVAQTKIPIEPDDTAGSLSEKLAKAGQQLLVEILPDYLAGKLKPKPQDDRQASVTKTLTKTSGRIDWTKPADYLARHVRAMQPWPGAWTKLGDNPVVITKAHTEAAGSNPPGDFSGNKTVLTVGTGSGNLVIDELKPAGKQGMAGADWLRGYRGSVKKFTS